MGGGGEIEQAEGARSSPDYDRKVALGRRTKDEFEPVRAGGARGWARLDIGDLEIVGKRRVHSQADLIGGGPCYRCRETRHRGGALKTFVGQRERAIPD